MEYTGARILVESLVEQGVEIVFGYPGSAVLSIYDELYKQRGRIRHILTSHEQHAAHAADGYARASGKIGVCIASSGPGATNLITGIAAAYMDSIPLVAITGNVATGLLGKDSFQEVDIAGISMPIVKHNWIVKRTEDLADIIREAFTVARLGRPGPVLVDIPKDIAARSVEWVPAEQVPAAKGKRLPVITGNPARARRLEDRKERLNFSDDDIARAASLIRGAKRPVLLAGGGVIASGADKELAVLAERLNAPVALSLMGIGAIPHGHRLCTGLAGMHGTVASNRAIQKADLLVALGTRFSDRVTSRAESFAKTAKVLHIDIDPAEINKNIEAHTWVVGDLKEILTRLLALLPEKIETGWNGEIEKWKARVPAANKAGGKGNSKTLRPRFIIESVADKFGPDLIAVTDVGQHQMWAAQFFPAHKPRSFLSPGGLGAMGFGLGAAIGVTLSEKLAKRERPVVLFVGDGGFRMNSAEMGTLVNYGIPLLVVVFNNQSLGMVRQWQEYFCEARFSETDLSASPDFVKLAAAYGLNAAAAETPGAFTDALGLAAEELAAGRAFVIDARVSRDEKVLPMVPAGQPIDEQIL